MLIFIEYYEPEKHDGLLNETIEVFKLQTYEDRSVYHTKQAGLPIEVTIFNEDAKVFMLNVNMATLLNKR